MTWALSLLMALMLAVVGCVVAGLVVMTRGGNINARWGNRLMRWRIWAQGLVIGLLFLLFLLAGKP